MEETVFQPEPFVLQLLVIPAKAGIQNDH